MSHETVRQTAHLRNRDQCVRRRFPVLRMMRLKKRVGGFRFPFGSLKMNPDYENIPYITWKLEKGNHSLKKQRIMNNN
jgi:hypothetical protein